MEETEGAARYWCHRCSQIVDPIMEIEMIKCPLCESGFVEEMESNPSTRRDHPDFGGSNSDRALSLWAPILLGMMSNPRRRRRLRRLEFDDDAEDDDDNDNNRHREGETELDRELESIIRRRRRSSATILQLLQGIRAGMLSESENTDGDGERNNSGDGERNNRDNRDRERVIVINPFNQTIIVQGSYDSNQSINQNRDPIGSLGDYFIGPGLDLLLQHLAENDPNRYGTPPAQKEAVEALPTVKIEETLQCSVCLDDFEIGTDVKEMPCKHKFHSGCILPWLELHSSCPVCRHQLPSDESKLHSDVSRNSSNNGGESTNNDTNGVEEGDGDGRNGNGRWFPVPLPWPFSSLFSSSGSENSSSTVPSSSSASSANAPGSSSHTEEN